MSQEEREQMHIANCKICTLAANMKDCKVCKFNIGLVFKGFDLIKQAEVNTVSNIQK